MRNIIAGALGITGIFGTILFGGSEMWIGMGVSLLILLVAAIAAGTEAEE